MSSQSYSNKPSVKRLPFRSYYFNMRFGVGECVLLFQGFYCPLEVTDYDKLASYSCSAGMLCPEEGWGKKGF